MSRPRSERPSAVRALSSVVIMITVAAILGVVVAGLAVPFAGLAGVSSRSVARNLDDLPAELVDFDEPLAQKTRVVDGSGDLIATLFDQNRRTVSLDRISRIMVKSIVGIEDYRFYQHGALDLKGTIRALITNQASGSQVQGGSSITQQLVKLTLVDKATTPAQLKAATDDTYARKIRELRGAIALEKEHSKDAILERYLNTAYFGDGAFGIQAAARHYFNVDASRLKLPQAAMLAGMVKNPSGYDPTNNPDRTRVRRNVVLARLAQLHVITQTRADNVSERPLGLAVQPTRNGCVSSKAQFFCDYVVRYLEADPQLGASVAIRRRLLLTGGLTIRTTIDLQDQRAAQAAANDRADPTDEAIAGLAMVEPGTGKVRALAQSRPMGDDLKKGETYLNYTIPQELGQSACCQAGSNFKPFVLATAINDGIPLDTKISAPSPMTFDLSKFANCPGQGNFIDTKEVFNSTGKSSFYTLYTGTQQSINTFFYQLEQKTGVCNPYNLAKAMGIRLTDPTGDKFGNGAERVPSFVLGVATTSPLEVAEAYATFAARGLHCDAHPVTSILDSNGETVLNYKDRCNRVMPKSTADAVSDILRGVQEPGGFGYEVGHTNLSVPSAAKTGTTQQTQAVWFTGYTPQLATSAMVGGLDSVGEPAELPGKVIKGRIYSLDEISGSGFAGPMWGEAMHALDDAGKFQDIDFVKPDPLDVQGVMQAVPDVSGQSRDDAAEALIKLGFSVAYGGTRPSRVERGLVAYTYPSAESTAPSGSTVTIYESSGPPRKPGKGKGGKGRGKGGRGR